MPNENASPWPRRALLLVHAVAAWLLVLHGWLHPVANWDIIPYAALVAADGSMSPAEQSRRAYQDVRRHAGDAQFGPMVDDPGPDRAYRAAVYRDPAALQDNLRFYAVKPLYIFLSRMALPLAGGNAAAAAGLVSAAALGLVLSLMPLFFRMAWLVVAALWLLLLTGNPPISMAARVATPDTLGMLFVALCGLTAVRRVHWGWTALLGLLAVAARPDAAFIVVPLLLGLAWLERGRDRHRSIALAASAGALFALFVFLGTLALPWSTLFWHTFVRREPFPSAIAHAVSVSEYLDVIRRTLPNAAGWRVILLLFGGAVLALGPWLRRREITAEQVLAAAACAGMVLHYLVFPIDEYGHERLFLGSYALILAAAVLRLERLRRNPAPS